MRPLLAMVIHIQSKAAIDIIKNMTLQLQTTDQAIILYSKEFRWRKCANDNATAINMLKQRTIDSFCSTLFDQNVLPIVGIVSFKFNIQLVIVPNLRKCCVLKMFLSSVVACITIILFYFDDINMIYKTCLERIDKSFRQ